MKTIHLAGCIIQDKDGKILLLHRNNAKRTQWEIPGGKIDEGENAADTAKREVLEELGIEVEVVRELDTKTFIEDTYTMKYTWFSAKIVRGTPEVMEPSTHDAHRFFNIDELKKLSSELSPNTVNFLEELRNKRIQL